MADDSPHRSKINCVISVLVEEGMLQDCRWKNNLVKIWLRE